MTFVSATDLTGTGLHYREQAKCVQSAQKSSVRSETSSRGARPSMARLTLLLALATAAHAFVPAPIAVSAKARTAPRAQRTSPMMAGAE